MYSSNHFYLRSFFSYYTLIAILFCLNSCSTKQGPPVSIDDPDNFIPQDYPLYFANGEINYDNLFKFNEASVILPKNEAKYKVLINLTEYHYGQDNLVSALTCALNAHSTAKELKSHAKLIESETFISLILSEAQVKNQDLFKFQELNESLIHKLLSTIHTKQDKSIIGQSKKDVDKELESLNNSYLASYLHLKFAKIYFQNMLPDRALQELKSPLQKPHTNSLKNKTHQQFLLYHLLVGDTTGFDSLYNLGYSTTIIFKTIHSINSINNNQLPKEVKLQLNQIITQQSWNNIPSLINLILRTVETNAEEKITLASQTEYLNTFLFEERLKEKREYSQIVHLLKVNEINQNELNRIERNDLIIHLTLIFNIICFLILFFSIPKLKSHRLKQFIKLVLSSLFFSSFVILYLFNFNYFALTNPIKTIAILIIGFISAYYFFIYIENLRSKIS